MEENFFTEEIIKTIQLAQKNTIENNLKYVLIDSLFQYILENKKIKTFLESREINFNEYKKNVKEHIEKTNVKNYTSNIEIAEDLQKLLAITYSNSILAKKNEKISSLDFIEELYNMPQFESYTLSWLKENKIKYENFCDCFNDKKKSLKYLSQYAKSLTREAKDNKLESLIGRENEIDKIINVLNLKKKNNPLLIGEAGVGKTAIIEGLAKKISLGEVPSDLKNKEIYLLNVHSLALNTKFRGDFEEKILGIINELSENKDIILFIDEIHVIMNPSNINNGMDIANMIKPALSNGSVRLIGATTYEEYKKFIEKESALDRRFYKINIEEPNVTNCLKIINGIKSIYEQHHNVRYTNDAIKTAIDLSVKYIADKKLPDKAIDLIDMAASIYKEEQIITKEHIVNTLSKIKNIKIEASSEQEKLKLKNLEKKLKENIVGQDEAIKVVTDSIILSKSNIIDRNKPIGSFLFAGPTGVGKTEFCKQLANNLDIPLLRLDMSELMEKHSVSKLIGSPPGYIGSDEGGKLIDMVKKTPQAVLLLDEIEKAHPSIYNVLLQIMDYGFLTDSLGRKADFKNIVLIMTSNIGVSSQQKIGFDKENENVKNKDDVLKTFSPEFYNRLDGVIKFSPLTKENVIDIINKKLNELMISVNKNKKISISYDNQLVEHIYSNAYDKSFGARPVERYIEKEIAQKLAKTILFDNLKNEILCLTVSDNKINVIKTKKELSNKITYELKSNNIRV